MFYKTEISLACMSGNRSVRQWRQYNTVFVTVLRLTLVWRYTGRYVWQYYMQWCSQTHADPPRQGPIISLSLPKGQIAHRVSYDDSIQKQDRIVKGIHVWLLEPHTPVEHRKIHPIVHIVCVVDNTFIVYWLDMSDWLYGQTGGARFASCVFFRQFM